MILHGRHHMINSIAQGSEYMLQRDGSILKEPQNTGALSDSSAVQNSTSGKVQANGDTVTISDEARKLSEVTNEKPPGEAKAETGSMANKLKPQGDEEGAAADPIKELREQIEQVKEKLQEAQARLAQAQASTGQATPAPNADPSEAAMKAAMDALTGNAEVEAIQAEIDMLNQQLLMLNNQLQEAMGGGIAGGASGTAGLGGAGTSGGLGERMPINA